MSRVTGGRRALRRGVRGALGLALVAALVWPSAAHTLADVEDLLADRERYFQPIDRAAPEFALEDADGRAVGLADLRGRVTVLHFIYTSCPDVCPLHAERLAEIQAMVNWTPTRDQVRFVTITTDPARDTPEVMRAYGPAHGLDPVNWTFLTSGPDRPEDTTRNLAQAFGHKFTLTEDGYQMHGVVTHVIDQQGRWRANFHGLKFEPTSLVVYLNALVNVGVPHHPAPTLWQRLRDLFGA